MPRLNSISGTTSKGSFGCLLLHGFSGGPEPMWPLAGAMEQTGALVRAPLIFPEWPWFGWLDAARGAYVRLRMECEEVGVIGLSLGALMALRLAEEYPVDRLAVISAPMSARAIHVALASEGIGMEVAPGLRRLMRIVSRDLFAITAPTLVVRDPGESRAAPHRIITGISSGWKKVAVLESECAEYARELGAFIRPDLHKFMADP